MKNTFQILAGSLLFLLALFMSAATIAQTQSQTFNSSGKWTVPSGVTQITVECWGAGGGGKSGLINYGTGGGGGGAYVRGTATVTPGTTYDLYVGAGGTGGAPGNGAATNGEWSWFGSSTTLAAKGGLYGSNGGGGQGGASYYCVSPFSLQVYNRGGNGYIYSSQSNGGGGGSSGGKAGSGINPQPGNSATSSAGASAPAGGGPGGNGGTVGSQTGSAPVSGPGGGGGGAYKGDANAGGNGANGQVIISWTGGITSISKTENTVSTISIYPNPAENIITVNGAGTINHVVISNILGETMMAESMPSGNNLDIDIKALPAGLYIIQLEKGSHNWVSKFIKQ